MPKYRLKAGENILFQGKHLKGGAIVIASYQTIKELKDKGINCFEEIKYNSIPVKMKTENKVIEEDEKPWMKSSKSKSKKYQI